MPNSKIPIIPEIPPNLPESQLAFFRAIKEAIEILQGQRGGGGFPYKAVTHQELEIILNELE